MPCRDYYDDERRVIDNTQTYKNIRDKLARIACEAMTLLEAVSTTKGMSKESREWFEGHKIADARAQREKRQLELAARENKRKAMEAKRTEELELLAKLQAKYGKGI